MILLFKCALRQKYSILFSVDCKLPLKVFWIVCFIEFNYIHMDVIDKYYILRVLFELKDVFWCC
ncbi:hypothetical protein KL86DYS1_11292 [uncultured Dysgonomonas sp.]|uniref:Uncharacterized protein n=1 Tax=uncultured Dysgonomonas sp. TaxID=206096 RepID=A0A212J6E9_9BACT|nr:hypothetical protein KL86DYS1_11292 [uncultured Dysgonomonas sp.]